LNDTDIYLAEEICKIGRRLYDRGYVAANDGNISVRASDGNILLTPSGVSKKDLTPEMIVKTDLSGKKIEGLLNPSSESGMHLLLYRENPLIAAAVHAHPTTATSFACAGLPLDKPIYPEAELNLGTVPITEFAKPGTPAVAKSVKPFCKKYKSVLLKNHGVLTWGKNLTEALYRMESVENYAKIILNVYYIIKNPAELTSAELKTSKKNENEEKA
jgi:L-fuculose-phosphate aldolase